jgi:hypothetical protein
VVLELRGTYDTHVCLNYIYIGRCYAENKSKGGGSEAPRIGKSAPLVC